MPDAFVRDKVDILFTNFVAHVIMSEFINELVTCFVRHAPKLAP